MNLMSLPISVNYINVKWRVKNSRNLNILIDKLLKDDCQFNKFRVSFAFVNEKRTDYPAEIEAIMDSMGFERSEIDNSYEWLSKSVNCVYKQVKEFTELLYDLK